jgi:hypothetical protein
MMLTKLLLGQILIVFAVVVVFIPHQLTVTPPLPQTAAHGHGAGDRRRAPIRPSSR